MGLGVTAVWAETHTRRSNADLIAAATADAGPGDLIVVLSTWEGITFDRYYHGRAIWMTVPPIDSHKVHRTDLVWQKLNERDPIRPVLEAILRVLESGHRVWVAGDAAAVKPRPVSAAPPPPPGLPTGWYLGPYTQYWSATVMTCVRTVSKEGRLVSLPEPGPLNYLEDLRLLVFSGYQPDASKAQFEQRMIK
jgi:alkanesulfonate monooxygenase SsuD/methylene tetrahydromethanopterin reductase-like flavin-dependent oxidoreductase (luciferase family)